MTATPRQLTPGTLVLCLGRVSTKKQATEDKVSLEQQAAATRAFVKTLDVSPDRVETWDDPGVSGLDRDRLEEIVAACEAAPCTKAAPGYVIVYDMSRFTRLGTEPAMYFIHRLRRAGWNLRDTTLKLQGTPGAEMADAIQVTVACEVAAELSRMLQRKVRPAMAAYAAQGVWQGAIPFGYDRAATGKLVPNADADTVREMFEAFAAGSSLHGVAKDHGMRLTVARWRLANPVYRGAIEWGKGTPDYRITEGTHAAIVPADLFRRVQELLKSGKGRHVTHRRGHLDYVLSGLVRGSCGHKLTGMGGAAKEAHPETAQLYKAYACRKCGVRVTQVMLERTVMQTVARYLDDEDKSGRLAARAERYLQTKLGAGTVANVATKRKDLEARKARLVAALEESDDADIRTRLRAITAELATLTATSAPDAKALRADVERMLTETRHVVRFALKGELAVDAVNLSLRRLLPLLPEVTYDPETRLVEVSFRDPFLTEVGLVPETHAKRQGGRRPGS